ncbi:MAG: IS3 family transposase [Acidimicrobiia bacterium]|nr:IS3 family transposase [Acidimicrobiia bacterium]
MSGPSSSGSGRRTGSCVWIGRFSGKQQRISLGRRTGEPTVRLRSRGSVSVTRLCALTGVTRSTFYEWRARRPSRRDRDDAALVTEITEIHAASHGTYGAPGVHGQLRHRGHRVGRKRVARLMAAEGFVGVHGRRKWRRGRPNTAPAPDRLQRDFTAEAPDQRWVADITEFQCWTGNSTWLASKTSVINRSLDGP